MEGSGNGQKVRIVLVDDEELIRAGLELLLAGEPDIEVVGVAGNGVDCLDLVASVRPDVVVMDVRMPGMDGVEATKRLSSDEFSHAGVMPSVLILTTFSEDQSVTDALRAGASGFLLKNSAPQTLCTAIRALARGEGWLDPTVTRSLLRQFNSRTPPGDDVTIPPADIAALTPREREVLTAMARGMKNAQIAEHLFLSETTVKSHVHRILLKLGLSDRSQAVAVAFRSGLAFTEQQPTSGVIATTKGILELYRLNPEGALRAIDTAEGFDSLPRFEPFIRGMALFASGRVDEALAFALDRRKEALQDVDQFILVSQSYIAALALLYRGLFDEAEYLMGRAFSLRRPGFLVDSLHNAMLRLSSLRDQASSTSSGAKSGAQARDVGPLPGTGKGIHDLVTSQPASAKAFDESASRLIDKALDHGFILEAVYSALFALCLLPGPRVKERLQRTLEERGITVHNQLLAIADAAIKGDLRQLKHLLDAYEPDGDVYQIAMLLRGAEQRSQLSGQSAAAVEIRRTAKEFTARFHPKGTFMSFEPALPGSSLTLRETEVALLAGQHSNQDIATHFGISIRTVESHISNALRKTDTTTRTQLADLIRNAQKPVTPGNARIQRVVA